MTSSASTDSEMERLKAENDALRSRNEELATSQVPPAPVRRRIWRWSAASILLVIGANAVAGAVSAIWTRNMLLDTERYTETVAPLAEEPAIQQSLSVAAVNELFQRADVEQRVEEALPPEAAFLSPTLTSQLRTLSLDLSSRALATPQFRQLWVSANREAHQALVPVLTGEGGPRGVVDTAEGTISVDIAQIVRQLKSVLVERGLEIVERVPDDALGGQIVIVESERLSEIQAYVRVLQQLAVALPVLALIAFAAAVAVAPNRRKGILWAGVATVVAMVALGTALGLARTYYLDSVDRAVLSEDAAAIFFDAMVRFLRTGIRTVAVAGALVVIGAALAGPSRVAVAIRSGAIRGVAGLLAALGVDAERLSGWFDRRRPVLDFVLLLVLAIILLSAESLTPGLVLGVLLAALLGVLIVELLARAGTVTGRGRMA